MTKFQEHLYRAWHKAQPRVVAIGICLCSMVAVFFAMEEYFRVVTIQEADFIQKQRLYAGTSNEQILLEATNYTLGKDDAVVLEQKTDGTAQLNIVRAFPVDIADGTNTEQVYFSHGTVAQALKKAGVELTPHDYTEPALQELVTKQVDEIVVNRVTYQEHTLKEPIAPSVEYRQEGTPETGKYEHDVLLSEGVAGEQEVTVQDRYVNGKFVDSKVTNVNVITPALNEVRLKRYDDIVSPLSAPEGITVNEEHVPSSYTQVYEMKATGYYAPAGKGASGLGLGYGTFAVDPTLIPYGTKVYIVSEDKKFVYGWAVATDTGSFIHHNRMQVDLFYETYEESVQNGAKKVLVYVP